MRKICLLINMFDMLLGVPLVATGTPNIIENVEAYHNNSKWQKLSAQETFNDFSQRYQLNGQEHLLDLCSGDGKISTYFASKLPFGNVVGVDFKRYGLVR